MSNNALTFSPDGHEYSQPFALLCFSAEWCEPCQEMLPDLKRFAEQNKKDIRVLKIDVDQQIELSAEFDVQAVPTLVLMAVNGELNRQVGAPRLDQLDEWLNPYINQFKGTGEKHNEQ